MSTVTLPTRELVGLLTDAALTAGCDPDSPHLAAVLLDCDHGEVAVPGNNGTGPAADTEPSDLMVATSTDGRSMAGQAHTSCVGRLHRPVLVSVGDVKALVRMFKPLAGPGKTTTRQAQLEIVGEALVVSEDPQQVPGGVSVTVPALDLSDYPDMIPGMLQPVLARIVGADGAVIEPTHGTGFGYGHLEIMGKIGKRRKMPVAVYRWHQRRGVIVEIGSMYRAMFWPCPLDEAAGQHLEPQVSVFTPRLPVEGTGVRPLAAVR